MHPWEKLNAYYSEMYPWETGRDPNSPFRARVARQNVKMVENGTLKRIPQG